MAKQARSPHPIGARVQNSHSFFDGMPSYQKTGAPYKDKKCNAAIDGIFSALLKQVLRLPFLLSWRSSPRVSALSATYKKPLCISSSSPVIGGGIIKKAAYLPNGLTGAREKLYKIVVKMILLLRKFFNISLSEILKELSFPSKMSLVYALLWSCLFFVKRRVEVTIYCIPTPLNRLIISHMQDLLHGYKTAWIGLFRHFSTLIGYFKWKPVLQKTRQMVQNYDGTLLELDWYFCHQPKKAISPITTALNSPESKLWFAELLGSIPEMILSEAEYVFMKNYPPALQPFSTTYLLENSQDSTGKIIEENQGERMLPPNYRCDGIISPDFTHAENSHEKKEAISVEDTSDQKGLSPDKLSSFFIASNTPFDHTKSSREYRKSMMGSIYNRQEGVLSSTASPYFPPVVAGKGYAFDNVIGSQIPLSIAFTARPVFLAIHGINGHSEEAYIIQSMQLAAQQGWHAVAMNHRGCGKSKLDNVFGYSAGGTQDIAVIANEIRSRFPYSPFFAAGFSLGANLLAKYIGECGTNCPIDAAACCANPWNLKTCAEDGKHSYTKRIYENVIVMLLKRYIQKNLNRNNVIHKTKEQKYVSEGLVDDIMDYTKVWLSPDSIHGFDTRVTSRIFGYEDVSNYWVEHSSAFIVDEIRIPCLCLNSSDDPIVPVKAIPMLDLQNNPNILFVLSSAGGHLGWLSTFPRLMYGPSWGEEVVVSFFSALLPHIRMKMFRALVKFRGEHLRRVISGRNASNDHIQLENHSTRIIGKSPNALVHSHHTDQNSPGASGVVNIHEATLNGTSPLVIDSPFLNTKNAVDSSSAVANSINPSSLEMQPDFRSGLSNQPSQSVLLNAKL